MAGTNSAESNEHAHSDAYWLVPRIDPDGGRYVTPLDLLEALRSGKDRFNIGSDGAVAVPDTLSLADNRIIIHVPRHAVTVDGSLVKFPLGEYALLHHLAINLDVVQTREWLYTAVWNDPNIPRDDPRLNSRIKNVRSLLGQELGNPASGAIQTARGVGYMGVSSCIHPLK